jgi:hypothetical protein
LSNQDALTRILEVFADAELRLRDAASKKILIEVSLLRAIEARSALSIDAVLKQLNQLRGQGGPVAANVNSQPTSVLPRPAPVAQAEPPPAHAAPATRPQAVPEAAAPMVFAEATPAVAPAVGNLTELWSRLIEAVGRASPFTRGYLIDAHPVSFEKGVFIVGFDPEFEDHLGLVDNARNHALLAAKLAELGHPKAMIKFIKDEAPVGWDRKTVATAPTPPAAAKPAPAAASAKPAEAAPAPAAEKKTASVPFSKDDFKNDPLIQKALEVFKGTIVEVRG